MEEWIQRANISAFRRLIAAETDAERRRQFEQILNELEARLEAEISDRLTYSDQTPA